MSYILMSSKESLENVLDFDCSIYGEENDSEW